MPIVVAYEAVWAMGKGHIPILVETDVCLAFVRISVAEMGFPAGYLRFLRGGSANAKNARRLLYLASVDGLLVGCAPVEPPHFAQMVPNALDENWRAMGAGEHYTTKPDQGSGAAMKQQHNGAWWLVLPAVSLLGLVGLIPLVAVINYSFFDIFTLDSRFWVGAEWYAALVGTPDLYAALGRSLLFTTLVLVIQFPLGVGIALVIPRNTFAKGTMLMILALPLVVPWNMIPAIWLGFINTEYGLLGQIFETIGWNFDYKFNALHTWILILAMDTWHWVGLVAILAHSGLSTVPQTYYQAAKIDGAKSWAVFRYIQLPKLYGVLTMALILRVMDSMMIYTEAFGINAGGPDGATSFLSLELGEDIAAFDYGPAAARSVVYLLIVLLVAWALQVLSRRSKRSAL